MRRTSPLYLALWLGACPGGAGSSDADTSSTAVTTGAPTSTSTPTTGSDTGASTGVTTGAGATTGEECDGVGFIASCNLSCAAGELCVFEQLDGTAETVCRPNPDGCVPADPCSPACAALCSPDTVCGATRTCCASRASARRCATSRCSGVRPTRTAPPTCRSS